MDLDELITTVEESETTDPLDRIAAAAVIKDQVEQLGDDLVDHFVKQARADGCSWTQIGDALGVTRQAAQQRHGGVIASLFSKLTQNKFKRFTPRARAAAIAAQTEARDRQHPTIDTEHVLLGLFAAGDNNVAVLALGRFGVDKKTVERLVNERAPRGESPVRGHIPFSPGAKRTLELALGEALELGHNYIGTEHIVLALRRLDEGLASEILAASDITHEELRTTVVEVLTRAA